MARYAGGSWDGAQAVATDPVNHQVYVTGSSGDGANATIAYSASGTQLWTVYADEPGQSIAVDSANHHVYVTGTSNTVAYDAAGAQLWVSSLDGYASSVAVDPVNHQVYVTGHTDAEYGQQDYATIALDGATGAAVWFDHYNGVGNGDDTATSLAVDTDNHRVYVTGVSDGSSQHGNYATVGYSATGDRLWVGRYDGPGDGLDYPESIGVDPGNHQVYVTGSSQGTAPPPDCVTIGYSASGDQLWVGRYNNATNAAAEGTSLAVDPGTHAVYVTGSSFGDNMDFATVAYDPAGAQLWVALHGSSGGSFDTATDVAVDPVLQVVYVAGYALSSSSSHDYVTVAYDPTGAEVWEARYNGPANDIDWQDSMAIDTGNHQIYVTGQSRGTPEDWDYATVAYRPMWMARFGAPANGADDGSSVAVDPGNGQVYVTGRRSTAIGGSDYETVAYDAAGAQLWARQYNGGGTSVNLAVRVAVDPTSHHVYVTGSSRGQGSGVDFATIAYSATGNRLWLVRYNGPANGDDYVASLAVDTRNHHVYVSGSSKAASGSSDYVTVAYNAYGGQLWVARYNGPGNGDDKAAFVVVDPGNGRIYVTGFSTGTASGTDYTTVGYSPAGAQLWVARYDGSAHAGDQAVSAAVDTGSHNVYVTGRSADVMTGDDYATVAYSTAGSRLWASTYNGPQGSDDAAQAVTVDLGSHVVYVTGFSNGTGRADYATVAYSLKGTETWVGRYDGPGGGIDIPTAVAVDAATHVVYVTGSSDGGAASGVDYATLAYGADGARLWDARYDGPASGSDLAAAIAVAPGSGTVYVTGTSTTTTGTGNTDLMTLAYFVTS